MHSTQLEFCGNILVMINMGKFRGGIAETHSRSIFSLTTFSTFSLNHSCYSVLFGTITYCNIVQKRLSEVFYKKKRLQT